MSYITPNMNLVESSVGVDTGLAWELNLNASLSTIDGHNHTSGQGVQIPPAGLNINGALTFQGNPATNLQASVYTSQSSLATLQAVYVSGVDLYYNDGDGNIIPITSGGSVTGASGTITGLPSGTAGAAYNNISGTFIFTSATSTAANLDAGSILLRNIVASSKALTLNPPASMAANYSLTLPLQPGSTSFMTLDSSGNMGTASSVSGAQIATGSLVGTQLANGTLTTTQISSSAGILGSQLDAAAAINPGQLALNTSTGSIQVAHPGVQTITSSSYVTLGAAGFQTVSYTNYAGRPVIVNFINVFSDSSAGMTFTSGAVAQAYTVFFEILIGSTACYTSWSVDDSAGSQTFRIPNSVISLTAIDSTIGSSSVQVKARIGSAGGTLTLTGSWSIQVILI